MARHECSRCGETKIEDDFAQRERSRRDRVCIACRAAWARLVGHTPGRKPKVTTRMRLAEGETWADRLAPVVRAWRGPTVPGPMRPILHHHQELTL